MNSLNAFKRIMEKYGKTNTLEGTYDDFLTIKKDLEVLQILKNRLPRTATLRVMEYEGFYLLYNGINCTSITKEEYELLKEWLSNDQ